MRPRDTSQQHDEPIDVESLAELPALESYLFSPPSLAPSADDPPRDAPVMEVDEAPKRLGFGLRRSMSERIGAARSRRQAPPPSAAGGSPDPFATLLTPLTEAEMARLRADVEADTILRDRVHHAGAREARAQRLGLIAAVAVAFALWTFWFDYLMGLQDLTPPAILTEQLDADHARLGVYVIGILAPVLLLGLVARAVSDLAGHLPRIRPGRLLTGAVLAAISAAGFLKLGDGQIGVALVLALTGFVLGVVARWVMRLDAPHPRRSRRGDGSPRR